MFPRGNVGGKKVKLPSVSLVTLTNLGLRTAVSQQSPKSLCILQALLARKARKVAGRMSDLQTTCSYPCGAICMRKKSLHFSFGDRSNSVHVCPNQNVRTAKSSSAAGQVVWFPSLNFGEDYCSFGSLFSLSFDRKIHESFVVSRVQSAHGWLFALCELACISLHIGATRSWDELRNLTASYFERKANLNA